MKKCSCGGSLQDQQGFEVDIGGWPICTSAAYRRCDRCGEDTITDAELHIADREAMFASLMELKRDLAPGVFRRACRTLGLSTEELAETLNLPLDELNRVWRGDEGFPPALRCIMAALIEQHERRPAALPVAV